jgi:hypothetical protein
MRYWLDKPMVDFINQRKFPHTEGNSLRADFEEWLDRNHIDRHYPDPDLHNRTLDRNASVPGNIKITVDHNHLEIIFSHDGNRTISQWNVLKTEAGIGQIDSDPARYDDVPKDDKFMSVPKQTGSAPGQFEQIADTDSANYAEPNEEVAIRMTGSGEPYTETTHCDSGHNHNRLDVTPGQGSKKAGDNPRLDSQVRNDAKATYHITEKNRKKRAKP